MSDEDDDNEESPASRKIQLLLELLFRRRLSFTYYQDIWGRNKRTFQRDLEQLRGIGAETGFFEISQLQRDPGKPEGEDFYVDLIPGEPKIAAVVQDGQRLSLLATIGQALGAPIVAELGLDASPVDDSGFLRFQVPETTGRPSITEVYQRLKSAWSAKPRALVEFEYQVARRPVQSHRVEPYLVVIRAGNAYLVGYDRAAKAWDLFALNRFKSLPERRGSFLEIRPLPAKYETFESFEIMDSRHEPIGVVVEISANVPPSVISANLLEGQDVEQTSGGTTRVTFTSDVCDAARWAFRFGPDAAVIAPPGAVQRARHLLQVMLKSHY